MATTHSRPPQSAALVEHPTLTKSMHPEYFHRSALPKAYELARTQKFGKDNLTHSYTTERAFPHVVLPLFKCGFLRRRDLSVLFVAYPRASVLWTEWRRVRRFDFRILRQPNPGWEAQTEIDDHRVDLRLACFLHYNMDFAALQRFHGGNHAGAHRDPDRIVPQIRDLVDPSVARDLDRILRVGCPALFNTEGTRQEFQEMFRYGNHKSLSGNIAKVMKTMNKEDKKEHVLTLPSWLAPLVPDLMLTPNGLVVKPGKNDRLVFDASFMLHADSRPFNHLIDLADEPDIVFSDAWVRYLIWIYNLRISYPDRDIHLFDDDVSGAFRQPKYHPNIISAKCFIVGRYLFGPSGLTFGDSSSPPSYEPFARARMALATHFSGGPQSIPEFPEYLNAVEFAPKASLGTVFARARPDKFNPGVPIPADGSFPPVSYNMHVDDNLYAAVGEPWMRWAMRCSIASLNVVMGAEHLNDDARVPTPEVRPKPCDFEKFTREIVSHRRRQLGCVIDTRSLMVEIPDDKRAEMLHELRTTWGPHRRSFTLVEAAKLLGTLVSLARVCAWGIFLVVNLNCALFTILASNARRLWNTPEFRELVGHRDRSRRHPTDASRFRFFSSAVARAIWNCKSLSWITRDVRDELDFVLRVFANSRVYRWASPIAHLIPREPDFQAWQDSCLDGAGGFSFTLHFWWVVEWPASIRCRSIRHLRQGDTSLISINLLEYAAIILGLAGAICAWESLPVEDRPPFPLLLSWTDNTTAESWTRRVAGFKGPQGRGLARLFAHLLMFSDVGVRAAYVPGELNDIADYLSRIRDANDFSQFSHASLLQRYPQLQSCRRFRPSPELLSVIYTTLSSGCTTIPLERIALGQI